MRSETARGPLLETTGAAVGELAENVSAKRGLHFHHTPLADSGVEATGSSDQSHFALSPRDNALPTMPTQHGERQDLVIKGKRLVGPASA